MVARLGGDEFIIVCPCINGRATIKPLVESIIKAFEKPFHVLHHILNTSVSIGITISPEDGSEVETLMRKADIAMYASKERNKSSYQYYSISIDRDSIDQLKKEQELKAAIAKKE